ncbi:NIPSNAP family protein [Tahibacter soli]|uniref:NIPSNAP family protein n=1 Tax=Tahibacter soli TaxID=2983605 RepID=A0A9X3YM49_9GAMM|nr:NIPSNAP family protein [Tahibacter soli]MDC8013248.1 NIPSNAP family protein [Tahibacter soli]
MRRLVEIRSYKLKPGTRDAFHAAMAGVAVPMLRQWHTDVVAFGPSAHAADTYFLVRAYADLDDLDARQDAFYGSDAWRSGPRESVISLIGTFLNTVLWLSADGVEDLRRSNAVAT